MKRQILLDTETTGMPFTKGHRIIEIGCIELIDRKVTKSHYHQYLNPEREVDEGAFAVHGLSNEFLSDKPVFADVIDEFLDFIRDAELIIHNASFDVGFLNNELALLNRDETIEGICTVVDTLKIAKSKFPGARVSLDALSKRYQITHFDRSLHGALLDASILAEVYLAMTGGQYDFDLNFKQEVSHAKGSAIQKETIKIIEVPVSEEELEADAHYFSKQK